MYDDILLPTDGSEAATDAAVHAFSHAERYDATVHVLSIVEISSGLGTAGRDEEKLDERERERAAAIEQLLDAVAPDGVPVATIVEFGSPARGIVDYTSRAGIDLVVMGTRARSGVRRLLFGSITDQVIQESDAPVLAVQRSSTTTRVTTSRS